MVGDAGLFFDPTDPASIAATISQALADSRLRDDLARRALDRAGLFTWDRAARSLLECFSELDSRSRGRSPATAHGQVMSRKQSISRETELATDGRRQGG